MPSPDFEAISKARGALREQEAALAASVEAARRAADALDGAKRRKLSAAEIGALSQAASAADNARRDMLDAVRAAGVRLGAVLEPIRLSPDAQLAAQARAIPMAMLPVRIETRLDEDGNLLVRIYPDQIHLHRHAENIATAEAEAGRAYWRARADGGDETAAWRTLAGLTGEGRARFLVARLRPGPAGDEPVIETSEAALPPRPEARLLPTAWCVTLLDAKGNILLRKWSDPVDDRLVMSPTGDLLDSLDTVVDGELALDPEARWLIDFKEASDRGMAMTIKPGEFTPPGLPAGIARLIVVGSDWSMTPEASAEAFADQMLAHSYAQGFGLPAHGTPTNCSSATMSPPAPIHAAAAVAEPAADSDLLRLTTALGLPPEALGLAGTPGTDRAYESTVGAVHTALWGSAFGFYLGQVMSPLVPDAALADTRVHVREFLRPAGPLPTIQIGRQPYGVLPVLATPVRLGLMGSLGGYEGQLGRLLANARFLVEGYSPEKIATGALPFRTEDILAAIPNLHAGTQPPAERLSQILKLGPLARTARVRPTFGAPEREGASENTEELSDRHVAVVQLLLSNLTGGTIVSPWTVPLIFQLVVPDKRYRLDHIPWVSADLNSSEAVAKAVAGMRGRIDGAIAHPADIKRLLSIAADEADTLFEGLLLLSGAYEYWEAGTRAIAEHVKLRPQNTLIKTAAAASAQLSTTGLVGLDPEPAGEHELAVESIAQLLTLSGPATGDRPLFNHLGDLLVADPQHPAVRDLQAFGEALDRLVGRPAPEVDQALRGLLDAGSHRLDAWITSIATRRLQTQRTNQPNGLHLGCYGVVHDLVLDPTHVSSEGYLHVPSADHAVTAAVLRAGHLANRDTDPGTDTDPDHEPFAVQLTSGRVREAMGIVEGMIAGQPASALLGYRFERWLTDDKLAARYILPLRRVKPLPFDADPPSGSTEALPPRDVVDGLALALAWKNDRDTLTPQIQAEEPGPIDSLVPFLHALIDLHDAFLDLWVTEAAHQMVQGNEPRMAAAIATLDRQERPPEPRVIATPRDAWSYAQRVIWSLPADRRVEGWPGDVAAAAEPVANAMAAELIGKPDAFQLSATVIDAEGTPVAGEPARKIKLGDLGLSPLALLRATTRSSGEGPSPLEQRIVRQLALSAPLPAGTGLELVRGNADEPGTEQLMAVLRAARGVLFDRPALVADSLAPPTGRLPQDSSESSLKDRVKMLFDWIEERLAQLEPLDETSDIEALRSAIEAADAALPVPDAILAGADLPAADLASVARALHDRLKDLKTGWDSPPVDPNAAAREKDAARIRLLLGQDFPVLPPFKAPAPLVEEIEASLADQVALLGSKGIREVRRWRRAMGMVRPRLWAFNLASDAAKNGRKTLGLRIAQLPHKPGARWASLPFDKDTNGNLLLPREVQLSLAVAGELAGQDEVAGVLIDDWPEAVPEPAAPTSLTFHYDAPAARPPQSILLAVDAGIGETGWSVDALVATVNEAFDLARLRLLPPNRIPGHGALLPTTFLPRNLTDEMPSFDLFGLAGNLQVSAVLGKPDL